MLEPGSGGEGGKNTKNNGTSRDRTSDLANFNRTLSQLSYRPIWDVDRVIVRNYESKQSPPTRNAVSGNGYVATSNYCLIHQML